MLTTFGQALINFAVILCQQSVFGFLVPEGVKPSEVPSEMWIRYGNSCTNRANFNKWVDRFKSYRTSVSGRY